MGKAKGLTKAKRSRSSPRQSASELNLVTTTFIEVGPNTPVCIAHRRCGPCIVGGNCLKSMHLLCSGGMHLTGGSAGELFIMAPLSSAQSLNYITCDHYHKKPQQQQLYQIPAKLVPLNEIGQSSGAVECSERHMRRVGRISPDRYFGNQTQMIRCPVCEAHSRKTLDNSTTATTTASTSSISDTEEIAFTRPPRQARARYSNHYVTRTSAHSGGPVTLVHQRKPKTLQMYHCQDSSPRRTSPGRFIAQKSETEMVSHQRGSNRPPHQSGGNWNHEPVKLVYENRSRESTRRSPSPLHRPRSALQQMRRPDSDTHTSRMNGASRIIYASKPDTPTYRNIPIRHASPPKGNTIGFRHDITASSSSESISTSITSLPQGPPVRPPDIELDVVPPPSPRPFDNRAPHGNLIKFETTRPADVPYFESASESNFDLNRPENRARGAGYMVARPQGNAYPGERMPPQPRIGYQEEELIPRRRSTKDPDLNMSFNFQCGADPHVPSLTPETSLGTQGPATNMKIQARSKTGDISTTTMPTDTPTGGNALDATLETVGSLQLSPAARNSTPRILPTLVSPVSNEESSVVTSQNGNTRNQDLGDGRESGFSSHAYEVVQEPPMGVTQGQDFGTHVEELATSVGVEVDILMPSQQSLGTPEEEMPSPPPATPPLPRSIDKVDPNSRNKAPLPSQDDNIDPQLDLSKKVSVQVGSLIQQRLKELTVCLGKDSQLVSRDTATAGAGDTRKLASLQPRTGPRAISTQEEPPPTFQQSSAPMKELPRTSIKQSENMDSFIDQQFGGLGRHQEIPRTSSEESADRQPPPVGWKDVVESPYQNLSADRYTKTPVGSRPELQGPPQADLEPPFAGSGRSGLPQPIQRGEFISKRVKELMAASGGDSHSVTSSGTATSLTAPEPVQFKLQIEDFRLVAVLGRGNFGKVLLAEYKLNNGYFALKTFRKVDMLRENCVDCMKIEKRVLQIVSEARHPCFVHMIACFQPQDYAVIVLDYLPGGDLMQHIQSGAFDEERTVFYAACVVLALEFLHLNDIMYRDLKLENLLLTGYGYLKLVDFGLCKENMGPNDKTNTFCGTPEFVAPEMITDTGYTRAVDWWCLGVLIYEMIVGKCPFRGLQEDDIYNSIVRHEPKIPLHVGPRAASIISQFMTKDPSRRLGVSAAGISDIKRHPFFSGLDFDALLANRVSIEDVSNFDSHCTSDLPRLTPAERSISPRDNRRYFADFDYT